MRDLQELLAHPALLVSHIKAMRADGDFQGAAALLREAQHQDPSDSEIRGLLAQTQLDLRFCDEKRAWLELVSEARELVEEHIERGELTEAQTVLTGVERRHGAIEELEELKERLQGLRHERELADLASHLSEAQRLKDEGYLQESVWEARQALALDPRNREATMLADSLTLEIEEQELAVAVRRDGARIGTLLGRGRLVRAGLLIRNSQRKYGNLPALQAQLQRRRRLRTTRWAGGWGHVSHTAKAPALWIRRRLEERGKARMRMLIGRAREERRAKSTLVSETRSRIEDHVERGEFTEAQTALRQAESRQGAIEELDDWRDYLQTVHAQWESEKLASHLSEARRLRAEDRPQDSLGEARRALTIDPQNGEATHLVDSLVSQLEERKLVAAVRKDAARIDVLLSQGSLGRAELLIASCRRKYGDRPSAQHQLRRCRRLRAVRWSGRGAKLQERVRAIPMDRIRAFPGAAVSKLTGVLADHVKPRLEERSVARKWVLVASFGLIAVAAAGAYLVDFQFQRGTDALPGEEIAAVDPELEATVAPTGDLILDALPWGRVVAIVGQEGEQQDLGESLFTPVRRSLPAGSYRVVMENPAVEEPAEFWVQVFPSGVTTKVHEFEPFDADAYFGKSGWQESGS